MKITKADTFILHVPVTRGGISGVVLQTDLGLLGYGCISGTYVRLLLGADPEDVTALWSRIYHFPAAQCDGKTLEAYSTHGDELKWTDEQLVGRVEKVRKAIGHSAQLRVGANGRSEIAAATDFAQGVREHNMRWLEEPLWDDDVANHAPLARAIVVAHVGDMMQVHLHLSLAHPACSDLEYIPRLRDCFEESATVRKGWFLPPREPGAGTALLRSARERACER